MFFPARFDDPRRDDLEPQLGPDLRVPDVDQLQLDLIPDIRVQHRPGVPGFDDALWVKVVRQVILKRKQEKLKFLTIVSHF